MTSAIRITDPDDSRIAEFTRMRERDLAGRGGRFIAEGSVVLRALVSEPQARRRFRLEKLLVLESRLEGVADVVSALPGDVPVYTATRDVIDAIAGFPMHRGVLGLGRMQEPPTLDTFLEGLPRDALVVVAAGIANHDNIGAIFRNAGVLGADAVLLDAACCDPLYRKAIRVSAGAVLRVPFARGGPVEELAAALEKAGFTVIALSPRGDAVLDNLETGGRIGLLLGTEGEGLSGSILSRFKSARIEQAQGFDSLNVATAAALALWRISRSKGRI